MVDNVGRLHMRITELLEENHTSKNALCKELDIPRSNLNRYCRDDFQRIDANLVCKLCEFFQCEVGDLIQYIKE